MTPELLAEIRERDPLAAATWFTGPASFTAQTARDRRALLAYIERLEACLRGVSSCSTCGACRGAAMLVLGMEARR